jgi:hypothetical protein
LKTTGFFVGEQAVDVGVLMEHGPPPLEKNPLKSAKNSASLAVAYESILELLLKHKKSGQLPEPAEFFPGKAFQDRVVLESPLP